VSSAASVDDRDHRPWNRAAADGFFFSARAGKTDRASADHGPVGGLISVYPTPDTAEPLTVPCTDTSPSQ